MARESIMSTSHSRSYYDISVCPVSLIRCFGNSGGERSPAVAKSAKPIPREKKPRTSLEHRTNNISGRENTALPACSVRVHHLK
jgi:hypothetical protein